MKWTWDKTPGRNDLEVVGGLVALSLLAGARFYPFGRFPVPHCRFRDLTHYPCPTCGGTHTFIAMAHARLAEGFHTNPLAALFFIALALFIPYAAARLIFHTPKLRVQFRSGREKVILAAIVALLALGNWVYLVATLR
ncbi:DUF2752 domain-containing protein [bacterium]|nr:DUF2752 domain-containing protein [bacterium]